MKKQTILISVLLFVSIVLNTLVSHAQSRQLKQVMTLKIDREGGANGANVAWHPVQKKYYAAMAGNAVYPMVVFDANGKMVSPDKVETMFDVRGLWYNPFSKTLQANGYDNIGWSEYRLDEAGIPRTSRKLSIVTSQPSPQSVGAYDPKNNIVYFFDYALVSVEAHAMRDENISGQGHKLYLGITKLADIGKLNDSAKYEYNENAIIFSGVPHAEIGLYNAVKNQIELYDISSGLMKQELKLPDEAPTELSLNFSYCNGIYWLFDKTPRLWHGYK